MIHPHDIMGARPLGDTGLFVGGFVTALDLVEENKAKPGDFKFFFNHLSWPAGALKEQVWEGRGPVCCKKNNAVYGTPLLHSRVPSFPWRLTRLPAVVGLSSATTLKPRNDVNLVDVTHDRAPSSTQYRI